MPSLIRTRILILSDTHAIDLPKTPTLFRTPLPEADIALHCGDLSRHSLLAQFEHSAALLRDGVRAPVKLVIPGNHDPSLDPDFVLPPDYPYYACAAPAAAVRALFATPAHAPRPGQATLLVEGCYVVDLPNGARLALAASPVTPAYMNPGAFQYSPMDPHRYGIPPAVGGVPVVDVVMTHGPARGFNDLCDPGVHAGARDLAREVAAARPRVHCYGHIHEAWGAELVRWKSSQEGVAQMLAADDADDDENEKAWYAQTVETANVVLDKAGVTLLPTDSKAERKRKEDERASIIADNCKKVSVCDVKPGVATLFVGAVILDETHAPHNAAWMIEMDLPASQELGEPDAMFTRIEV